VLRLCLHLPRCLCYQISLEENLQLREDLKAANLDIENYKAAVQQLLDQIEDLEEQRSTLEGDMARSETARRVLEREVEKVRLRVCSRTCHRRD
jgi:septal ring factor EnvC (AmiA/AmiB activator)